MKELKDRLSNLIENNKIDEAIKILKEESAKRGGELDHIIISVSSRYKRYREKSLMGLEARDQEFTKIVSDTLQLVQSLENPAQILKSENTSTELKNEMAYSRPSAPSSGQSNKYVQMGIGGLAVIGIIALIAVFAGGGEDTGYDDSNTYDETYIESDMSGSQGSENTAYNDPATYENTNVQYDEPTSGSQTEEYPLYDVSGHWRQVSQSFGPENDCADCTIDITQNGTSLSVVSNGGMYAQLEFISQYGLFEGILNWGNNDPEEAVQIYFDENNYLVMGTMIQGSEYYMYFAE